MSFLRREQMDCCNYVEAMGNKILVDSKSNWMHLESLEGNTTQVQTTGAQMLDTIYSGFLISADGARSNDNNYRTVWLSLSTGTYTIAIGGGGMIVKTVIDGVLNNSSTSIADGAGYTCTLTQDGYLGISFRKQDSSDYTEEPQVMLNLGNTALLWEPYTGKKPSPSVEYPQDFVGADIKSIKVQGAQLFDISNPYSSIDQWVITNDTISITNPTGSYLTVIYKIDCKPNTTYTIYSLIVNDVPDSNSMHIAISLLKKDETTQDNIVILNNTSSATFTTTADTQSIYIYFRNRSIGNGGYFKNIIINEGKTTLPWQPYYNSQIVPLTFTESLNKVGDYADEITSVKRINRCIELTFDGSENWDVYSNDLGFQLFNGLPYDMNRRAGFCNQYFVQTQRIDNQPQIWLGINNKFLYAPFNKFFDDTLPDKGLSAWKAHLSTNPLKVITYTNPEGYVETPLEQSNIDGIKSLYAYDGYTIVNNNENTNMKIMYKTKS